MALLMISLAGGCRCCRFGWTKFQFTHDNDNDNPINVLEKFVRLPREWSLWTTIMFVQAINNENN